MTMLVRANHYSPTQFDLYGIIDLLLAGTAAGGVSNGYVDLDIGLDSSIRIFGYNLTYDADGHLTSGTIDNIDYYDSTRYPLTLVSFWESSVGERFDIAQARSTNPGTYPPSDSVTYEYWTTFPSGSAFGTSFGGGPGNDYIGGSAGADVLSGSGGDDSLRSFEGNDDLRGGTGNDTVDGGDGADFCEGGDGGDSINGGFGDDTLDGGQGNDTLNGDYGHDVLLGFDGDDHLLAIYSLGELYGGSGKTRSRAVLEEEACMARTVTTSFWAATQPNS
jgi:Ca2+-binding RTX toxin-like protein